jgi:uncharacterized protein YhaN
MGTSGRTTVRIRLQNASNDLAQLERLLAQNKEAIDPRVLQEFRQSVNHLREAVAAVKQWIDLRNRKADAFLVLAALSAERVRAGTELCKNLVIDLDNGDVTFETPGIVEFGRAVHELHARVARIVKA